MAPQNKYLNAYMLYDREHRPFYDLSGLGDPILAANRRSKEGWLFLEENTKNEYRQRASVLRAIAKIMEEEEVEMLRIESSDQATRTLSEMTSMTQKMREEMALCRQAGIAAATAREKLDLVRQLVNNEAEMCNEAGIAAATAREKVDLVRQLVNNEAEMCNEAGHRAALARESINPTSH